MRRLVWPALSTAAMLAVTLGLGLWQVQRLHWKQALLSEIEGAEGLPAVPLPADPAPFAKVSLRGHWRTDLRAWYGSEVRPGPGGAPLLGAQLVMPLEREDGPPVLVDRGWVPEGEAPPEVPGEATVVGYVRPAERASWLAPAADIAQRRFWALDPQAIGGALGLPAVAPFTVVALGAAAGLPEPATALPRPPNNHLQYALTWFGLALCLVGVFVAYVRRTLHR